MKLHELHVGERHAGSMRDRIAVARRHHRVRRVPINLPASTRGQHRRVSENVGGPPGNAGADADALPAVHEQVEHARALEHLDVLAVADASDESPRHLGAGLVAVGVNDAILRVCRLASQLEPAAGVEVEVGTGGLELAHARRPFLHQHGGRIAQRGARGQGVLSMQRRRVAGSERRGDAALRIRGRAVEERSFGEEQHVAVLRCAPSRMQAGDTAADDEKARANTVGHLPKST